MSVARYLLSAMAFAGLAIPAAVAQTGSIAPTPPMGWNSWNHFQSRVSDKLIRETADAMAENGMRAAGYVYINIDDTWEGKRDTNGNITSNEKFPDMKALADYVHSKGFKLGIYSSPGPKTCTGYEGSYQHEAQDAQTYASWGIDYLKYDWCSASTVYRSDEMPAVYKKMGDALRATGRPIVYSLCQTGQNDVWEWGASVGGNLWRTTGDIIDKWSLSWAFGWGKGMAQIGFNQNGLDRYAGPGHWNDPDMLQVGNGGMSDTEYHTHFSLWCLLSAPLLAGNDIAHMTPETKAILTNRELIAVDQDPLGKQAVVVTLVDNAPVYKKPLADGSYALGIFNTTEWGINVTLPWRDAGLPNNQHVRDLWAHEDLGVVPEAFKVRIPSHGVVVIRVRQ
ncbi:MAG: glycoside hydrolase family 27 protein [Terriglobales bacterium]